MSLLQSLRFWSYFYFSFTIFTTISLGDWYPKNNKGRFMIMVEGSFGW
ncbi:MAG: potassium channel family protein [Candidatus Cloacimonetes bacterium]|nr:potassium channel family protein [Candidatus Cloacimonadota bacterium]